MKARLEESFTGRWKMDGGPVAEGWKTEIVIHRDGAEKNILWKEAIGKTSYGGPVIAGGKLFVGTNNESLKNPKQPGDRGVLMAFRESDGEFLWQHTNEKLPAGRVNDWPYQGVCSSPLVEGDRLYYVSNRCEVVCLDTKGFRDGVNDGPYKDEKFTDQIDADIIWKFDMMEEVGSSPHNMSNSSPVSYGDLIFVSTSNGQDETHVHIPSPRAPAISGSSARPSGTRKELTGLTSGRREPALTAMPGANRACPLASSE